MGRTMHVGSVTDIHMETRPASLTALYMVEAQTAEESHEIAVLFSEFESALDIVQLSSGKLMTYAARVRDQEQSVLLDEIYALVKARYHGFAMLQKPIEHWMYELFSDLCRDYGGKPLRLPTCNICGKPEAFPGTVVNLLDERGGTVTSRAYCATCTAEWGKHPSKEFLLSLLEADRSDFEALLHVDLVTNTPRKRRLARSRPQSEHLAFRLKADAEHQSAVR